MEGQIFDNHKACVCNLKAGASKEPQFQRKEAGGNGLTGARGAKRILTPPPGPEIHLV